MRKRGDTKGFDLNGGALRVKPGTRNSLDSAAISGALKRCPWYGTGQTLAHHGHRPACRVSPGRNTARMPPKSLTTDNGFRLAVPWGEIRHMHDTQY